MIPQEQGWLETSYVRAALERVSSYPRLRYMGSKYKVMERLLEVFSSLNFTTALDAFSGSGVVAYALKALGKDTTANDFLHFSSTVAKATVENRSTRLSREEVRAVSGHNKDGRSFIADTFRGLYFPPDDLAFLDAAWSQIEDLPPVKRALAISALCLSAARKQPRGVFTVTDLRYDDGRRDLRMSLPDHFERAVADLNSVVFDSGTSCRSTCRDVFDLEGNWDLVYLDPPYAPPRDDNCYIKRYHFLEGLSVYWRGQRILPETATKKLAKRYTPFSYKRTIEDALRRTFEKFADSIIVLSYSSNAVPDRATVMKLLRKVKSKVEVVTVPHWYSFGTHANAARRTVEEFIFVAE